MTNGLGVKPDIGHQPEFVLHIVTLQQPESVEHWYSQPSYMCHVLLLTIDYASFVMQI